jgi:hypothetical protein
VSTCQEMQFSSSVGQLVMKLYFPYQSCFGALQLPSQCEQPFRNFGLWLCRGDIASAVHAPFRLDMTSAFASRESHALPPNWLDSPLGRRGINHLREYLPVRVKTGWRSSRRRCQSLFLCNLKKARIFWLSGIAGEPRCYRNDERLWCVGTPS